MTFVPRPAVSAAAQQALASHAVPISSLEDACRGCAHLEGDDADDYPKGFEVDLDSEMLGSLNNFHRQILISSGQSDWQREVTDSGFPALVKASYDEGAAAAPSGLFGKLAKKIKGAEGDHDGSLFKGVYPSSAVAPSGPSSTPGTPSATSPTPAPSTRLSILSSSLLSSSDSDNVQSVIVLPDFKIVHQVAETKDAGALVDTYLRPGVGRAGAAQPSPSLRSWPLPYSAVVLLCSHKRRDKRCHIAAPLLLNQFHHHLEHHGLEVDERGDDCTSGPPIEEWEGDREAKLEEALKSTNVKTGGGRVGIFKVSHIGGHRYAGNVIIYLPNGTCVYYGRVTPRDVGAIVETTLIQGKVIPELLRGGLGLAEKNGPDGILGW